ncbi:MAG TPA: response regulator [Pirellulaceae bacterium]|nr:response regulator [Pirellulaceae bacterium]
MLVVSRRPNDRIVFPKLGITVHVVRVDGKSVRLGIDAPRDVRVLRHEIADKIHEDPCEPESSSAAERRHEIRNRLNTAMLALHLVKQKLHLGLGTSTDLEPVIDQVIRELYALDADTQQLGAATPPAAGPTQRRTALVVEDNANECELLAGFLRTFNFQVATVGDGADALAYLSRHQRPDIVLLDMNLPRVSGNEAVREIRGNPALAGVKLFAISGMNPGQCGVTTGPQGVDRWFSKPIRPDALVAAIDRELSLTSSV